MVFLFENFIEGDNSFVYTLDLPDTFAVENQQYSGLLPEQTVNLNVASTSWQDRQTPSTKGPVKSKLESIPVKPRFRTVYSPKQLVQLEKEFQENNYLNRLRKIKLSKDLDLTERQIKVWFQNRRVKSKKGIKSKSTNSYHPKRLNQKSPVTSENSNELLTPSVVKQENQEFIKQEVELSEVQQNLVDFPIQLTQQSTKLPLNKRYSYDKTDYAPFLTSANSNDYNQYMTVTYPQQNQDKQLSITKNNYPYFNQEVVQQPINETINCALPQSIQPQYIGQNCTYLTNYNQYFTVTFPNENDQQNSYDSTNYSLPLTPLTAQQQYIKQNDYLQYLTVTAQPNIQQIPLTTETNDYDKINANEYTMNDYTYDSNSFMNTDYSQFDFDLDLFGLK